MLKNTRYISNWVFQMYFNTVLTHSAKLLKPLLVFSFVMLAILAGLTRIIQFRNHPVDVYCGWLLGAAIAVYLVTVSWFLSIVIVSCSAVMFVFNQSLNQSIVCKKGFEKHEHVCKQSRLHCCPLFHCSCSHYVTPKTTECLL